jgi:sirohydrochlorin cobaltochelatase
MKAGILVAAFGSSNPMAQRTLSGFEARVREAFPGLPVRWAFTSGVIRRRLADEGKKTDSVLKALQKMRFERFTHVAVQSLHIIPGSEYHDLLAQTRAPELTADGASGTGPTVPGFERLTVGAPLLADAEDVQRAAGAVLRHLPEARTPAEAVVLMGHGTWHDGDAMYQKLADALGPRDRNIHVGTMEGVAGIEELLANLQARGVSRVWLMPLLAVVGAHATRDMAGDGPTSWKSVIQARGLTCTPVLQSSAEYAGFAEIWIDHLRAAMDRLMA